MADLTGNVEVERYAPRGQKDPTDNPGGLGTAVMDAATKGIGLLGKLDEMNSKSDLNEAASAGFNIWAQDSGNPSGLPAPVAKQAGAAVGQLNNVRSAEDQGRVPLGTLQMQLQSKAQDLMNAHPTHAAELAEFFQKSDYYHPMFDQVKNAEDKEEIRQKSVAAEDAESYKFAYDHGVGSDDLSYDQNVAAGKKQMAIIANVSAAKDAAEAARAVAEQTKADTSEAQAKAKQDYFISVGRQIDQHANTIMPMIFSHVSTLNGNPDRESYLQTLLPTAHTYLEAYRAQALSSARVAGYSAPDDLKSINDQIDGLEKSVNGMFEGTDTDFKARQNQINIMKQKFAIDDATALPMYERLKADFGENAIAPMLNNLDPKLAKQVQQELAGYNPMSGAPGLATLATAASVLRGTMKFSQVPAEQVPGVLAAHVGALTGYQGNITSGKDTSHEAQQGWMNSYSTVIDASQTINPNSSDVSSAVKATNLVANQGARNILSTMLGTSDGKERGQALMDGSRATAQKLLMTLTTPQNSRTDGYGGDLHVAYDPKAGRYVIQGQDGKIVSPASVSSDTTGYLSGGYARMATVANAANADLTHLVQTSKYDPSPTFSKATPLSLANFYATHDASVLVDQTGKKLVGIEKPANPDQEYSESVDRDKAVLSKNAEAMALSPLGPQGTAPNQEPQGQPKAIDALTLDESSAQRMVLTWFPGSHIVSGFRTDAENIAAHGVEDSMHKTGQALDFHAPEGTTKAMVAAMLKQQGFPYTELLQEIHNKPTTKPVFHIGWRPKE